MKSTDDEIKRAHKNLVKVFHPDAPGGGDEALFRQIQDAFETLSDKERRVAYDRQQREKEAKVLPTMAHQVWGLGIYRKFGMSIKVGRVSIETLRQKLIKLSMMITYHQVIGYSVSLSKMISER